MLASRKWADWKENNLDGWTTRTEKYANQIDGELN